MRKTLFSLIGCLLLGNLFSQTAITTDTITTATWTLAGSPYNVNTNIVIPPGHTLTIEAGVKIIITDNYYFKVHGYILAEGTEGSPISLTATSSWQGLDITNSEATDSSIINYCEISGSISSGISISNTDKVRISNSRIFENSYSNNSGGGINLNYSDILVINNIIELNSSHDGGGIYAKYSAATIKNNIIRSNSAKGAGGGLDFRNSPGTIAFNLIYDNSAIYRGGGIQTAYNTSSDLNIYNNTIVRNESISGGGIWSWKSKGNFFNNVIWNNTGGQFGHNTVTPILFYNASEDSLNTGSSQVVLDSGNNDTYGPMFSDPSSDQFTLQIGSPLVGAGTPEGVDIGYTGVCYPQNYYFVEASLSNTNGGNIYPEYAFVEPEDALTCSIYIYEHYELTSADYSGNDIISELTKVGENYQYTIPEISSNGKLTIGVTPIDYPVEITSAAEGKIIPSDISTGNIESTINLSIQPDTGYVLATLIRNGENILSEAIQSGLIYSYILDSVIEQTNINATYKLGTYQLTSNAGPGGTIYPDGIFEVDYNDTIEYIITPDDTSFLDKVLLDGNDITDQVVQDGDYYKISVKKIYKDMSLNVSFYQYVISTNAGKGGSINPSGEVHTTYNENLIFDIRTDLGYRLLNVIYNGTDITDSMTQTEFGYQCFIDTIKSNGILTANFEAIEYLVTASADSGGSITPLGDSVVTVEDTIEYSIIPDAGWSLTSLLRNDTKVKNYAVENGGIITYLLSNVTDTSDLKAIFSIEEFVISTNADTGGVITPSVVFGFTFWDDTLITITPLDGYEFDSVMVNNKNLTSEIIKVDSQYVFAVDSVLSDLNFIAYFTPKEYDITVSTGESGNITPSDNLTLTIEDTITFIITPDQGWNLTSFMLNGTDYLDSLTLNGGSYYLILSHVSEDINIKVNFAIHTGVKPIESTNIKIYPIPCSDYLNIELNNPKPDSEIRIFDINGQTVMHTSIYLKEKLNISYLSSGCYTVIIKNGFETYSKRIIKK